VQAVFYLSAAQAGRCKSNQGIGHVLCTVPRLPGTVLLQKRKKLIGPMKTNPLVANLNGIGVSTTRAAHGQSG
jgi:hypothetical protein